jgi:hypothetical protein
VAAYRQFDQERSVTVPPADLVYACWRGEDGLLYGRAKGDLLYCNWSSSSLAIEREQVEVER